MNIKNNRGSVTVMVILVALVVLAGILFYKRETLFSLSTNGEGKTVVTPNSDALQNKYDAKDSATKKTAQGAVLSLGVTRAAINAELNYGSTGYENKCDLIKKDIIDIYNKNVAPADEYSVRTGESISDFDGFECVSNASAFAYIVPITQPGGSSKTYCMSLSGGGYNRNFDKEQIACK